MDKLWALIKYSDSYLVHKDFGKPVAGVLFLAASWKICACTVQRYLTRKLTVLYDIPNLGTPRPDEKRIKGAAVICGGSIAGLWAARICADHFEEVIVVEPEDWLQAEEGRKPVFDERGIVSNSRTHTRSRVSQYKAAHVFQPLVLRALKKLFPDFETSIRDADGRIAPAVFNAHVLGGAIMKYHPEELVDPKECDGLFISRESFERILRGLVLGSSRRIRYVTGTVTGLQPSRDDPTSVESAVVRTPNNEELVVQASLIVDCTGGSQAGLKWLRRLYDTGCLGDLPMRDSIPFDELKISYNTHQRYHQYRFYVPPEARSILPIPGGYDNATWIYTVLPIPRVDKRYFFIHRIDGHRLEFNFTGWGDPPVPRDFSEIKDYFLNYGESEQIPEWILELVDILLEYKSQAETDTGVYPAMNWIRYEKAPSLPTNFIAIGDSVMRVNPVFGQGCTKAAMGAITLDSMLRSPPLWTAMYIPVEFGRNFFKVQTVKTASAWDGTKPSDYQWESTEPVKGEKLEDERLNAEFSGIVMQLALKDKKIDASLVKVKAFIAPPTDLLHPRILAKVAFFRLRRWLGIL